MKVTQIHTILNSIQTEILGENAILKEDLSNVVDMGKAVFDATSVDNYVKKLVDKVGKVIFGERKYAGGVPSVFMDKWEFGAVMQKITAELPMATKNESWDLQDGQSYDQNVFHQPKVENKFFSDKVSFEIPMSFTEMQVKSAFNSATEMNSFLSMIVTTIENAMTVKVDSLIMRTINNMTATTLIDGYGVVTAGGDYGKKSTGKAVNLLKLFNDETKPTTPLKAIEALNSVPFLRFATYKVKLYQDRMIKMSKLFNVGGKARFTPKADLQTVLLSDFKASSETMLLSDTFNKELVTLPDAETVPYWQGSGVDYDFASVTGLNVQSKAGLVVVDGILGVMFDKNALGVCNTDRRVTTNYNAKGEFYNNYYKFDAGYFNDTNENFIVFFVHD